MSNILPKGPPTPFKWAARPPPPNPDPYWKSPPPAVIDPQPRSFNSYRCPVFPVENQMKQSAIVLAILFSTCSVASPQSSPTPHHNLEIRIHDVPIGTIDRVQIEDSETDSRILIHVDAIFDQFGTKLDKILREKGNIGGCQQKLFWRGSTSVQRGGETLKLSSRLAYEAWTCPRPIRLPFGGKIQLPDARWFGDVRNVDWTLFIKPATIDNLYISARVDNIVGWPNWVEKLFGARITESIAITLPESCGRCMCSKFVEAVQPDFERGRFDTTTAGAVRISATFSIKNTFITEILRCSG